MGSLYGFVVAAWLFMPDQQPIPFATVESCRLAAVHRKETDRARIVFCMPTGASDAK